MTSGIVFWLWFAGLAYLLLAVIAVRKELSPTLSAVPVLGRVFAPVGLALFGAEHLAAPKSLAQGVPQWMPGHLFWAYFVGFALFAAATSIALNRYARLSASLLGLMFVLFVLMIHAPNVAADPRNRIIWTVALREIAFACGVFLFAKRAPLACRIALGAILVFFAVEHFLHPDFIPGVPLGKMTPPWFPLRSAWGYLTGLVLLATGAGLIVNKQARFLTTWLGMELAAMVALIYLPILAAAQPKELVEALNYIGDTTLFAGIILLAAGVTPDDAVSFSLRRRFAAATLFGRRSS
ncbi:MAG TPA: hypothetical protein VHZ55_12215 [Bryobacteraceae bacterium]|jgi:uncharacterized membrane protein|nr:hypothetical protein [Bryobacteraceae bacterium]